MRYFVPKVHRVSLLIVGILALSSLVSAQNRHGGGGPLDPDTINGLARDYAKAEPGGKYEMKARQALRERKFADVERFSLFALNAYEGTIFERGTTVHETLAESYLIQKKYGLSLAEAVSCKDDVSQRFLATKHLALVGLGQVAKARADFTLYYGTALNPIDRKRLPAELPMDDDASNGAFVASLYIMRASFQLGSLTPESLEDLKAAEALAPRDLSVNYMLATYFADKHRYEDALAYYDKLTTLNDAWAKGVGEGGGRAMRKAIALRDGGM